MIFDIGIYQLDIDVVQTADYYKTDGGIVCDCDGCQNYAQVVKFLPSPVLRFFQQFGIDPQKPAEVYVNYAPSKDTVHYGGFYHICGTILKGTEPWIQIGPNSYALDDQYRIELCKDHSVFITTSIHLLDKHFPAPAIQIEIEFILPWVLNKPNSYLD